MLIHVMGRLYEKGENYFQVRVIFLSGVSIHYIYILGVFAEKPNNKLLERNLVYIQ